LDYYSICQGSTRPGMSWKITLVLEFKSVLECPGRLQVSSKMGKQDHIMISESDNPTR